MTNKVEKNTKVKKPRYRLRLRKFTRSQKKKNFHSLKVRATTAIVLISMSAILMLIVLIPKHNGDENVFNITKYIFVGFATLLAIIAAYEMCNVKGKKYKWNWQPFVMMCVTVPLLMFLNVGKDKGWEWSWTGVPNLSVPVVIIALFVSFPLPVFNDKYTASDSSYIFANSIFIALLFKGLIFIAIEVNIEIFLSILVIAVATDTFAYFGGFMFGQKKLSPNISPKKTWEGAIIGTIMGSMIGIYMFYVFSDKLFVFENGKLPEDVSTLLLITLPVIISLAGQIGDLTFSAIKRRWGVKDFSNIFPGHGGVLDRGDSIAGAIFVYLAFYIFVGASAGIT